MDFRGIPVEVESVAVKVRDKQTRVLVKLTLLLAGQDEVVRRLRRYIVEDVLPRPEIGTPVDLEGLDQIEADARTPEEQVRLDRLLRRRSAGIKVSCAAPRDWWDRARISLWRQAEDQRGEDALPAVTLYPAEIDGKITVEVLDDAMSATMTWRCLAEVAEVAGVVKVAELFDRSDDFEASAVADLTFEASQLEMDLGQPEATERVSAGGRRTNLQ